MNFSTHAQCAPDRTDEILRAENTGECRRKMHSVTESRETVFFTMSDLDRCKTRIAYACLLTKEAIFLDKCINAGVKFA